MKKSVYVIAICALVSGCMNVRVRMPWTETKIADVYQCSMGTFCMAYICAFPQVMSDCPGSNKLEAYNILTVPLSLLFVADAILETAVDTVFLPADYLLKKNREE